MLALRAPLAASSGTLVTLTVFALLWQLVGVPIDIGPPLPATKVEFKRLRFETPIVEKRAEKAERPPPPPTPETLRTSGPTRELPPTELTRTRFEPTRIDRSAGPPLRPDGDVIPIVRTAPEYPPRELERGTEGWVQVRFAVTAIGTVRDALVVDAEPAKVFDQAALKAVARWRYNPRVENGVAVERVGLQAVIRFEIDE